MKISELRLIGFRNHKKIKLDLGHEVILLTGENGAGKTNILEAIHLLSTAKSMKAKYDKDIVNYTSPFSSASADIENSDGTYVLEIQIIKGEESTNLSSKKAKVNKVAKSLSAFSGIFNSVLFSPEDLNIITGAPSERRKYIDSILVQTDSDYKKNSSAYIKALRQRNKILEKISEENRGYDEIEYWTEKCLQHGTYIQLKRARLLEYFNKKISGTVAELNGTNTSVEIKYLMNEISPDRLEKHKYNEIKSKNTLVGPHRDDFCVFHKNHELAEFGSRGEQRSVTLALKLCEISFIENENGERPVLLLDDIFSELDEKHRSSINNIVDKQQTIITSAESAFFLTDKRNVHQITIG